jgi:hypothetical protein
MLSSIDSKRFVLSTLPAINKIFIKLAGESIKITAGASDEIAMVVHTGTGILSKFSPPKPTLMFNQESRSYSLQSNLYVPILTPHWVELQLPPSFNIHLAMTNGRLDIAGMQGDLYVQASKVTILGASSLKQFNITAAHANINLGGLAGNCNANVVSGAIDLAFDHVTSSTNIRLEGGASKTQLSFPADILDNNVPLSNGYVPNNVDASIFTTCWRVGTCKITQHPPHQNPSTALATEMPASSATPKL